MAVVDGIVEASLGIPGVQVLRADLTGATSTWTSKFGAKIQSIQISVRSTNAMTYAVNSTTGVVTITGTNDDTVDILAFGYY